MLTDHSPAISVMVQNNCSSVSTAPVCLQGIHRPIFTSQSMSSFDTKYYNYFLCSMLWLSLTNTKCCCCLQWGETCLPRAELLGTEGEAWLITTELMVPTSGCAADPLLVASECCCCCAWSASAEDATGTVAEHTADWLAVLSIVPITLLPDWFGTSLLSSEKPRKHQHKWKKEMLLKTWYKSKKAVILVQLSKKRMLQNIISFCSTLLDCITSTNQPWIIRNVRLTV